MSERFTKFKRVTSASLAIVFLALQAPLGLFGTPKAAATFAREDKVTYSYCYVAGTDTYIQKSAEGKDLFDAYFKNGNSRPGDIIPEFTYLGKKYSQSWSLENQIIHGNDCKVPKGTVEVSKKVDTDADGKYVDANGKFSDFRWGFSDETPARLMGSDADVKVGTYAVNEKAVNGYKFVGWYYTGVHGKSCATPNGTTLPISVNVTKNVTTKVTVCNQRTTGSITIVKDAQPNAIDDFKFEIDRNNSSWDEDFTLDDDTNNAYSNTKTYNKLPTATYVITEKMTPAQANTWKLSDIACEGAQVTKTAAAVTINLSADQNVTCTFVNQKRGKITVNKETVGANTGIFSVTASGIGAIDGTAARLINAGGSVTYVVDQGTYTIAEQDKDGWLENATGCQSVVVSANDLEKTCTIVNTKAAKLQIKKQTRDSASSNQSFNFTTTGAGLDDFDLKGNESKSFTELAAGQYTVSEAAVAAWTLAGVECKDGVQQYPFTLDGRTLSVDLKAGDDVTCTFTNEHRNTINGQKFEDVNGNGEWDEGEPALAGWTITVKEECRPMPFRTLTFEGPIFELPDWNWCEDAYKASAVTDEDGNYSFNDLKAGVYTVCEEQQEGWVQTKPWSESDCYSVDLSDCFGKVEVRDFGNYELGKVNGYKFNDANNNGTFDEGEEKLSGWTITLSHNNEYSEGVETIVPQTLPATTVATTTTDEEGNYGFADVMPGTYLVCEKQQTGWAQTFPADNEGCHEVTFDTSGQIATANFGNHKPTPVGGGGQVLGATTPVVSAAAPQVKALVNTGSSILVNMFASLAIIGVLGAVTYLNRKQYV